jgi:hypothetical protein
MSEGTRVELPVAVVSISRVYGDGTVDVSVERPLGMESSVNETYPVKAGQQLPIYATTYSQERIAERWGGEGHDESHL